MDLTMLRGCLYAHIGNPRKRIAIFGGEIMRFYARRVRKSRLLWAFLFLAFLVTTLITVGKASAAVRQGLGFSLEPVAGDDLQIGVFDEKTGDAISDATIEVAGGEGTS